MADLETRRAALIDAEEKFVDRYLALLAYHGLQLEFLIETHTHADHISCARMMRRLTGTGTASEARLVMHAKSPNPHVQLHVQHSDLLKLGPNINLRVLETPGHTPDSISLYAAKASRVFTGDALLIGGTGRTDFAGGSPGDSYDSITQHLFTLPDETTVLPAHDYRGNTSSSIGHEKQYNPRVANATREQYIETMQNLALPLPEKIMEALQVNIAAVDDQSQLVPRYSQLAEVRQMAPVALDAALSAHEADELATDKPFIIDVREPFEVCGLPSENDMTEGDMANFRAQLLEGNYPSFLTHPEALDNHLAHRYHGLYIPVCQLPANAEVLDKDRHIVLVCRAGIRSSTAAAILTALGFPKVSNLKGGLLAWTDYLKEKK